MTNTLTLSSVLAVCESLSLEDPVFLWLVTSGNTAVHFMAFHMNIIITQTVPRIYAVK